MRKCKDCEFWDRSGKPDMNYTDDWTSAPSNRHICFYEGGDLFKLDGFDCNGNSLYTSPDFGCIAWERRTDQ